MIWRGCGRGYRRHRTHREVLRCMKIGFIEVGNLGAHLAVTHLCAGFPVTVHRIDHTMTHGLGVELDEEVAARHPYDGDKLHLEMLDRPV